MRDILLRMNCEIYDATKINKQGGPFVAAFETGRLAAFAEVYEILKKYTPEVLREYDSLAARVKISSKENGS